jgi:spermidine/putrescine transport system substrate-binding protein
MGLLKHSLISLVALVFTCSVQSEASKKLYVLSHINSLPETLLNQFSVDQQIEVIHQTYDDFSIHQIDLANVSKSYDLVLLPSKLINSSVKEPNSIGDSLFHPIDLELIPNLKPSNKLDFRIQSQQGELVSIPLLIESYGYAINSDMIKRTMVSDWGDLWDRQWTKQILLLNDAHIVLGMALVQLGYSVNTTNKIELDEAFDLLLDLAPNVLDYGSYNQATAFLSGDISLGLLSNRDAFIAQQEGAPVDIIWSHETSSIVNLHNLAIPKNERGMQVEAHNLLNFLLRPRSAANIAFYAQLPTTVLEADNHLPQAYVSNRNLNPPKEVLLNSQYLCGLEEFETVYNSYFYKLKSKAQ